MGATVDGSGVNFAVFSAHAERIDLCLFDSSGRHQTGSFALTECTDEVWHGYLPGANAGLLYGYLGEYKKRVPLNYNGFSPAVNVALWDVTV